MNFDVFKKNDLEKNLTAFIKPQTVNIKSKEIKKKLYTAEIKSFIEKELQKN